MGDRISRAPERGDVSSSQRQALHEVRSHTSGVQIELTPPDKDVRNAGLGLLSIPGQVLSALETKERLNLYREVYSFEGFYRCTRIDTQFTVLEPPISIYDFVDEVSAAISGLRTTQLDNLTFNTTGPVTTVALLLGTSVHPTHQPGPGFTATGPNGIGPYRTSGLRFSNANAMQMTPSAL